MYIADHIVTFSIKPEFQDLFENAQARIRGLKYQSRKMEEEVKRYVPNIKHIISGDDKFIMVVEKAADLVLLRDALEFLGGQLSPRNVAWIMSTLHNLTCYLRYTGISHNAISIDTYFVSPPRHYGTLLGGWWYATALDAPIKAVPTTTYNLVSQFRTGNTRIDAELIRAVGRTLLGDAVGLRLTSVPDLPEAMRNWLRLPGSGNPVTDYQKWQTVLADSFGPNKFTNLPVTAEQLYGGET